MRARLIPVGIAFALLLVCVTVVASCGQQHATPAPSPKLRSHDWAAVACGSDHTVALRKDGTLWAWGGNDAGQLGLGDTKERHTPIRVGVACDWTTVACGYERTSALLDDGSLWTWGLNYHDDLGVGDAHDRLTSTQVGGASDWAAVACGYDYTLAVKRDRTLWARV